MKVKKIAILGGGNGGLTCAADLSNRGFLVNLFESQKFCKCLDVFKKKNEIIMEYNERSYVEKINLISNNIEDVIRDCEIIIITVPGIGIEYFAEILAPVLKEEQIILINGSPAMSSVRFVNRARKMGIDKLFKIGETNSLTYGTRAFVEEGKVKISFKAGKVSLGVYPSQYRDEVYKACIQIYPCFVLAKNILQVNLENPNPLIHPVATLLNAGRIDYTKGEFYLYREGITKHVVNIIKALECERDSIGKALGITLEEANETRINRGYFENEDKPLDELFRNSESLKNIKGPNSVEGRYIIEDISTGLVLWSELGKVLKVDTANIDAIITLGSTLVNRDLYKEGLTLKNLGLGDVTNKEELLNKI